MHGMCTFYHCNLMIHKESSPRIYGETVLILVHLQVFGVVSGIKLIPANKW